MERGVSLAQIRVTHSVVYQLICQVCKRATVWNCLSSVIIDQIERRERERERRTTPIALFAGGVVADGYEERTFWKFCDTCACTFRSVIKQLRWYEGRDNSALELTDRLNIRLLLLSSSIEFFHLLLNTFFINLLPSVCFEKFRYNF